MQSRVSLAAATAAVIVFLAVPAAPADDDDAIPRTASGRPDFTGDYEIATLTPLQRPREFGDNLYLTSEQAEEIVGRERERVAARAAVRRIDEPPPPGGAPPIGLGDEFRETSGAGNVGGYNSGMCSPPMRTMRAPTVWSAPWSGEYLWPGTPAKVYEYACHEGNYAMGNILRGARLLEDETRSAAGGGQ